MELANNNKPVLEKRRKKSTKTTAATNIKTQVPPPTSQNVPAGFIIQVAKIPVVNTAINCAFDAYGKAKALSPPMIKRHWSSAEETVSHYATTCVLPVVESIKTEFNKPIQAVDALACKTLDKVIETLPVVNKSPEEIMSSTRLYATSAVNIVSGLTDLLLNNRLGQWTLKSMEFSVGTVRQYVDHFIPPTTGDSVTDRQEIPDQPSQKIFWAIFQMFHAIKKVQHHFSAQAQQTFENQSAKALIAFGGLVGLLDWVSVNWKDNKIIKCVPETLQELANYFRGPSDGEPNGPTALFDNVISLASYFANQCGVYIRGALKTLDEILVSKLVTSVRLQLNVALAFTTHFVTRVIQTWTNENMIEKVNQFFNTEFPFIQSALLMAGNATTDSLEKDKVL